MLSTNSIYDTPPNTKEKKIHHNLFRKNTEDSGKKVCRNVIRGCRTVLELEYQFSRCSHCLQKDRDKDREKREKIKLEQEKLPDDFTPFRIEDAQSVHILSLNFAQGVGVLNDKRCKNEKKCTTCFLAFSLSEFQGNKIGMITKTCKKCRDSNKRQDLNRNKEHRLELARIAEKTPERKEKKKEWKIQNADKLIEIRNRIENQFKKYIKNAKERKILFTLDQVHFQYLIENTCYYCGVMQENGYNGIDRKQSSLGYITDNYVSCCKICNYMKGSLDELVFICRILHILSYQNKIEETDIHYDNCFGNTNPKSIYFDHYYKGAVKRNLQFELNKEDFQTIILNKCYICGKANSNIHQNGIDRRENEKGYLIENCLACCGECNFMKKNYSFEILMNKIEGIYCFQKQKGNFPQENGKILFPEIPETNIQNKIKKITYTFV